MNFHIYITLEGKYMKVEKKKPLNHMLNQPIFDVDGIQSTYPTR